MDGVTEGADNRDFDNRRDDEIEPTFTVAWKYRARRFLFRLPNRQSRESKHYAGHDE